MLAAEKLCIGRQSWSADASRRTRHANPHTLRSRELRVLRPFRFAALPFRVSFFFSRERDPSGRFYRVVRTAPDLTCARNISGGTGSEFFFFVSPHFLTTSLRRLSNDRITNLGGPSPDYLSPSSAAEKRYVAVVDFLFSERKNPFLIGQADRRRRWTAAPRKRTAPTTTGRDRCASASSVRCSRRGAASSAPPSTSRTT